ncbi:MAG TPA: ABC transporter substrate-binding protein [Nitrososphaerales archaeon]|nr:ABC transporter substrate-binding protein [Nitrososphaerales archaeon]
MITRIARRRSAVGRGVIAAVVIIVILIAAVGIYYASTVTTSTTSTTTTSSVSTTVTSSSSINSNITTSSQILSLTFANVPNADPAKGSDEASCAALVNLYDTLVFPTASGAVQPDLATSWNVSANGLTYTFNLRQGVTFHNGDPLNASAVVFSMNRMITMGQGFSYLFSPYIVSTNATGPYTVVFHLGKTFGPFLSALVRLYILDPAQVMAHIVSGPYGALGDYGSTWLLTHDAGSGPYTMTSANLEANMIFQEYTNYWNGTQPNQPKTVQYIGIDDPNTVKALFTTGAIQITDMWQPYQNIQALSSLKGAQMVVIPSTQEMYLMINTQKAPTDDLYVREAMSYALNYTAVVDQIFPGTTLSAGPVPVALPGHDPAIPPSTQNLALAKQLIQQSKYYKDGNLSSYPVTYYWVTAVPAEQKLALEFASDMQQIGITVNIVGTPWLTVVADLANETSSPNIVSIEDAASYYEAGSLLQSRYTSAADGTWEQNEWLLNSTLDNIILGAVSNLNQTQRFQGYYNAQEQIYHMYPTIYAFDVTEVRAYYPSVVNWYPANGHPIPLLGYDFYWRNVSFYPQALASLTS